MEVKEMKTMFYKYSPLWYSTMAMKAFCNGDRQLADRYYADGQKILDITGSMYLPLPHCDRKETFSISKENKK
jgi:hypothetical protein